MISNASARHRSARVGVDVGGTFTDAVVEIDGRLVTAKRPSTPHDQSVGVVAAVQAALAAAAVPADAIASFGHGMTVGTNALLERTGAAAVLVTTRGFADLLELRRQNRADLYRLDRHHAPPVIARERVVEVDERVGPDGVVRPLEGPELDAVVERVRALAPEAIAVGLLFSFADDRHERMLADALRAALPGVPVSISSRVLNEIREYERIATTAVDAYLAPVLRGYLDALARRARDAGLPEPTIMQSNGGVIGAADAARHSAWTVLSGPAAGVIGAAALSRLAGIERVLTFDMGGTSCDVALIDDGEPSRTSETVIAGTPVSLPMLDIETVSAGGGSVAWRDSGGALRVGPRSAGAEPGPAAYGRGGDQPTVTDANLVLDRLDPGLRLGDDIGLDRSAAWRAVAALADTLGLSPTECAQGILRVAVEEMVRALRRVSVERGIDPRSTVLLPFGGAGPLHACAVAERLGIDRILLPPAPGLLAALGLIVAGERRDYIHTVLSPAADVGALRAEADRLSRRALSDMPDATLSHAIDCRYRGQAFALTVPWSPEADADHLLRDFHAAHRRRYGDAHDDRAVEAVSLRVAALRAGRVPELTSDPASETRVGPCRLPLDGATCYVAEGWRYAPGPAGMTALERI